MQASTASVYRKAMHKAVLTLLLGLMLLASGSANALSLNCQRTVESHDAFSTIQAFESWFPKTIRPTKADQIPTSKDTQIRFKIKGAIYDLTPSKWMLGKLPEKGGYKSVTGVRYKCDASSHEVKLALQKNSDSSSASTQTASRTTDKSEFAGLSDGTICKSAAAGGRWETAKYLLPHVFEAKRRGLTCGVNESSSVQTEAAPSRVAKVARAMARFSNSNICKMATYNGAWHTREAYQEVVYEAKRRGLTCGVGESGSVQTEAAPSRVAKVARAMARFSNSNICKMATYNGAWHTREAYQEVVYEAKRRGLTCGVGESGSVQTAAAPKPAVSSAALNAAQQQAEAERQKRLEVEAELAALKAEKEEQQQTISSDNQIPLIEVASQQKDEATALIYGRAKDNVGVADVLVNNEPVQIGSDGSFQTQLYIPPNGVVVEITAYDLKGNKATKTLSLNRSKTEGAAETRFAQLQPSLGKQGAINRNAIALIVGVEKYENLPAAPAIHADKDAEYFADFAHYKLGVPRNNIIKAINSDARRLDILKALAKVTQLSKENETEVFIFFAGHGLAADDGKDVFLIPYDGDTGSFLAETAITRSEIFQKVERIGPKSVTVFLDACYTGGTRSQDVTLVASKRPVQVKALNQSVPQGFTILSASASDETSMALEAAKHGMFSYFLMKGMEGDADAITIIKSQWLRCVTM